ncbi:lipocalin family protein [Winogradskyella flava]|uniref:lipocalin family protein n=1 Tax=Winogradskyella flava TaxID=1884876 RepID=UPI0024933A6A|nr:lipocalin family protein [Winogradskyella flava]
MKIIKYISIFVLTALLFSCSKSDDNSERFDGDIETLILGNWKIESKALNGEVVELFCTNGLSSIYTFNATNFSYNVDMTDGNDCVTIPYSGTYSVNENTITIISPFSENEIWTVTDIDNSILSFSYRSFDNDDDVYTETYRKL